MKLMRIQNPSLWNWSSTPQLSHLRDEISRLFEEPFGLLERRADFFNGWSPNLDLYEDKESLVARVELPGLKKEEIDVWLEDGALHVAGERKFEQKDDHGATHRLERFYGRFHRTVTLPKQVKADNIKATYEDGVLTVTLPKAEEAKPRQITVTGE
ncbi:MAG TPA: Hsp20/alpha crystallin family protein [Verrucomicrobiae bacterium]